MKYRLLFIFLFICLVSTQDLMAIDTLDKLNNLPTVTMTKFDTMISQFYTPIKTPAMWLFVTLGSIQLVITFGFMLLRGEFELGAVMAALIRFILLFGLFWAFFNHIDWMKDIFNSFTKMADNASKGSVSSLDKAVEKLAQLWDFINKAVDENSWKDFADSFSLYMIGIIETVVVSLLIGYALMTYAFFIFSIYVGVFWIGFGSFDYTRAWAINSIVNILRWGAKWMMQLLIISVTFTIVNSATLSNKSDFYDYLVLVIISLMMVTVSFGSNSFVDSYFNGHGGGDNNAGVAMAQRFVSNTLRGASNGLANGAKAGYSAITKANSANSSKSSGSKAFGAIKTMGAMVAGATFGATVGGIKGAAGANGYNNGYGSGSFSATALNGATKAAQKGIDSVSELSGKITESITGNNPLSSKDRNGFDTSLINDDSSSMSGEIKPS